MSKYEILFANACIRLSGQRLSLSRDAACRMAKKKACLLNGTPAVIVYELTKKKRHLNDIGYERIWVLGADGTVHCMAFDGM